GTARSLTSSETTMEDTHVWLMNADGSNRHEVRGTPDDRQGPPRWSPDGRTLVFTLQERGESHLYSIPAEGGVPHRWLDPDGAVGAWSIAAANGASIVACALARPQAPADLYVASDSAPPARLTDVNGSPLKGRTIGAAESFT